MKLLNCPKCNDIILLIEKITRICLCGHIAGKYLEDRITAVVTEDSIIFGIDNNGFHLAKTLSTDKIYIPKKRIDFFFVGWIPTKPGEVIKVETIEEVEKYDYHMEDEDKTYESTSPVKE